MSTRAADTAAEQPETPPAEQQEAPAAGQHEAPVAEPEAPETTEAPARADQPLHDRPGTDRVRRALPGRLGAVACVGVAAIWLVLDQATKVLAVAGLSSGVVDLGVFDLHLVRNPGGAFGIPGFTGLFVLVTIAVIVLIARALPRTDRLPLATAYGLVAGGALGNLMDRLFREPGFPDGAVVDFVDLGWWPVFNLADVGIVIGAVMIAALLTVIEREERAAERDRAQHESVRPETSAPHQ